MRTWTFDAAIRANESIAGSPAALRLEQEQREARERAELEQREAQERAEEAKKRAEAEAKYVCASCSSHATKRCGGCEQVRYCNQTCLTQHWPEHKLVCREMKEAAAVAAAAKAAAEAEAAKAKGKGRVCEEEHGNCWTCGADNPLDICGVCMVAKYCDMECAMENQEIHKGRCAQLKEDSAELAISKEKIKAGPHGLSPEGLSRNLVNACLLGRLAAAEKLIAAGAVVNYCSENGSFALKAASREGHVRVIDALVRHGAAVNKRNGRGDTPLSTACLHGQLKAAAALLGHGALVESREEEEFTLLISSAYEGHVAVVRLLLEHGAQVDLPNAGGATPLLISAELGDVAYVRLLLQAGADPLHRAFDGSSPLAMASANNHPEIVALLQTRVAEIVRERRALQRPSPIGP